MEKRIRGTKKLKFMHEPTVHYETRRFPAHVILGTLLLVIPPDYAYLGGLRLC